MDALSELIALLDPRGRMDLRCLFGQDWAAPHEAIGPWRAPFHILLRGQCELWLPDKRITLLLDAGTLVVLPRGSAHVLRTARDGATSAGSAIRTSPGELVALKTNQRRPEEAEVEILCGEFEFHGRRRSMLLDALPDPIVIRFAERPEFAWIEGMARLMVHEIEALRPGAAAMVAGLSGTLFTLVVRASFDVEPALTGVLGVMANPRVAPGLQAMLGQPSAAWTVASLAERCHLSRATFAREFTRSAGIGPVALLTAVRMELASRLLMQGELDTASVGEAAGYRSEAAFNRAFARYAGTTPGRFKRLHAKSGASPDGKDVSPF